jgi:hypothetical protein
MPPGATAVLCAPGANPDTKPQEGREAELPMRRSQAELGNEEWREQVGNLLQGHARDTPVAAVSGTAAKSSGPSHMP